MDDGQAIIDLLKNSNARISDYPRWLIWSEGNWVVLSKEPYQKKTRILYNGHSIRIALKVLKGE